MTNAAGLTTTGLLRGNNEDCAAVDGELLVEDRLASFALDGENHLLVLTDGIGGYEHGEVASRLAVEALSRMELVDEIACADSLQVVNGELYAAMRRDPQLVGMGTTIVGVAIRGRRGLWFNVGDSRAYLYRGRLSQLTTDHVPAARMPDGNRSHMLTQWLGGTLEDEELWPATGTIALEAGDRILLCSDGLTDVVSDDEIADELARSRDPDVAVSALVDMVVSRGAPDNVTILLASI